MGWCEKIHKNCCARIEKEDIDDDELIGFKKNIGLFKTSQAAYATKLKSTQNI